MAALINPSSEKTRGLDGSCGDKSNTIGIGVVGVRMRIGMDDEDRWGDKSLASQSQSASKSKERVDIANQDRRGQWPWP